MTAPFTRFLNVAASVVAPLAGGLLLLNTGEGLRVDWNVRKSNTPTPDTATIAIYNLGVAQRQTLVEVWRQSPVFPVQLLIGWDNLPQLVYNGDCWKVEPERRLPNDILTVLECGDGLRALRDAPPPLANFAAGTIPATIQAVLAGTPGLESITIFPPDVAVIEAAAAAIPLQTVRNLAYTGDSREFLDDLFATLNLSWSIQNGFLRVFVGGVINDAPSILQPNSGLLEASIDDDGDIKIKALAQPRIVPGAQILVRDEFQRPLGSASHRVESITFTGSTDGESTMEIVGRRPIGVPPQPIPSLGQLIFDFAGQVIG